MLLASEKISSPFPNRHTTTRTLSVETPFFPSEVILGAFGSVPLGREGAGVISWSFNLTEEVLSTLLPLERARPLLEFVRLATAGKGSAFCRRVTTMF